MKKVGFMIVYDDVDYVDRAISSFKDFVDEMIIVEGAFEITTKLGKPPRSSDGTLNILDKHVDNKKVFLKQVNLREHKDHYDIGYQAAISRGADWAIMIDSDEIWTNQAKVFADKAMHALVNSDAYELRVQEYCFINDFKTWYPGQYPRIFKCKEGSKFVFDNEVLFSGHGRGQHPIGMVPGGRQIFHYGYVRGHKRWKLKQDYMWEKDFNPGNKQYTLTEGKYVIPADIPIYKFEGTHPKIMQDHAFFNMTANQIIYGDDHE